MSTLDRTLEPVRRLFRAVVPTSLYSLAAQLYDKQACIRCLGIREARRLRSLLPDRHSAGGDEIATFRIPGLLHPISVRPGTTDPGEVIHTAIRKAYGQYLPPPPVRFIIDAGANIGDTSSWYLSRFPQAKVFALEPDTGNFQMLRRNCEAYGNRAILRQAALWPRRARLTIVPASAQSGISVVEANDDSPSDLIGLSPDDILSEASEETIDIFKCDIEGAELQLFSSNCTTWLSRTRCLVIEIHGSAAHRAVLSAVGQYPFTHTVFRDLHIFHRTGGVRP